MYLASAKDEASLPRARGTPERIYEGNVYLYRYSGHFRETPSFTVTTNRTDRGILREHVNNTAVLRTWITADDWGYSATYILPDYDVDTVREIADAPHDWVRRTTSETEQRAAPPPAESLMAVQIRHYPITDRKFGAMIATVMVSRAVARSRHSSSRYPSQE